MTDPAPTPSADASADGLSTVVSSRRSRLLRAQCDWRSAEFAGTSIMRPEALAIGVALRIRRP